jgi:hypothetical protein
MKLEDKSAYLLQKEPARWKRAEKERNDQKKGTRVHYNRTKGIDLL